MFGKKTSVDERLDATHRSEVIRIAWPVLLELLLASLFSMVDMMMLGNVSNKLMANQSVAAVGIVNQPLFIGISLVQSVNVGCTALVSRYIGAGEEYRIEDTLKHVLLISLLGLALPYFFLVQYFKDPIMAFLGAEPEVVAIGGDYYKILMTGFLFQAMNFSLTAALRGAGETKVPMKVNITANLLNVFGNAVLIFGLFGFPAMGITGAGISTALSNVLAFLMMYGYVLAGKSRVKLSFKRFSLQGNILSNLVKIGIPASMEQFVLRAGIMLFAKIVAGLGTAIFAAHSIALSILGLSFNPGMAFGISASALVGRALGEEDPELAASYGREARKLGSVVASLIGLVFFVFAPQLVSLYNKDPVVIKNAAIALRLIAVIQPIQSSQLILSGALRGAGDTISTFVATMISILFIRVSLAYLFVTQLGYGITGAWAAVLVDQFVRWYIIKVRFDRGRWKAFRLHA